MSEAKELSGIPPASVGASEARVVPFPVPAPTRGQVPPLTDQEIVQIRQMIQQFNAVKTLCPIARTATQQD